MSLAFRLPLFLASFGALNGLAPATPAPPSAETLAALDPTRLAATMCGRGYRDALRDRLALAAGYGARHYQPARAMPLLGGVPASSLPITVSGAEARRYFDQGLVMTYGFNHEAAIRSFRRAQALDPRCAMCWWGEAMARGPNINAPMDADALRPALAALAHAKTLAAGARPHEQALIEALSLRYSADPGADRATLDKAYADAMLKVAGRFPEQDDISALAAEAIMDTSPWNYWQADGTPRPGMGEAIRLVDIVRARNPQHVQADHLQIHLMEATYPARAEGAADSLAQGLSPGAGHLVHMPSHIYYRLGRYRDSIKANVEAIRADEAFLSTVGDNGLYRYGYYPHNVHFVVSSAQMAGDMKTALGESRRLAAALDSDVATDIGWIQLIHAAPYLAHAQFAPPEAILALPDADARMPLVRGLRHYSRAIAYALEQDRAGFDAEVAALDGIARATDFKAMTDQGVPGADILGIAAQVARGRYAMLAGRFAEAADHFEQGARLEEALPYLEPPIWYYPVRQSLGAALYRAGRYEDAKQAFMASLARSPANGWALWGLARSEEALGQKVEAAAAEAAFGKAWMGDARWLRMERL